MARSKVIEGCSDKILPRFSQFVGTGWSDEILFENHVDSLSTQQIDRLCRSVTVGLLFELVQISERRLAKYETTSNSESFAVSLKCPGCPCSCFKELWIMLIQTCNQQQRGFWSSFSILLFGSSKISSTNNLPNDSFDHNSSQLQFECKEFSFKLLFWLTFNIAPLVKISTTGKCKIGQKPIL